VRILTSHSTHNTGRLGDKSFQAIDCTGTDNQNKETKIHQKRKRQTEKNLSQLTKQTKLWFSFTTFGQEM